MKSELVSRLSEFRFDYFVTLATNHSTLTPRAMRDRLKIWDARMNRFLIGPKWNRRPDERLVWFAFLEKAAVNPHWHLLVELDPAPPSATAKARQARFEIEAKLNWEGLVKSGDVDVKTVADPRVIEYCSKELWSDDAFTAFVCSREFQNNK
ncbi:hypothetical protein KB874_20940 [Aestuariicoccus sp. KMU-90]|uniref:Uncharacterized protein n=2 Tax=Thetidibacter halocola TaxID=2827239 RepID=A0A8J7WJT5_9RHOB|nr:hypothetical protein [Thetidibacter halocola]